MLAKKYRLPVQSVLGQKSSVVRGHFFSVKIFPAALSYSRFGAVVSKKAAKKSSTRVALRRIIYASMATLPHFFTPPRDIVIIATPFAGAKSKDAMIKELHTLLTNSR